MSRADSVFMLHDDDYGAKIDCAPNAPDGRIGIS